jgi:hydroxymethylpyrimidine pyrophosphatase-like HAD family hydrolase
MKTYTVTFSGAYIVRAESAQDAQDQLQQMTGDEILEHIEEHSARESTAEEEGIHRLMQGELE